MSLNNRSHRAIPVGFNDFDPDLEVGQQGVMPEPSDLHRQLQHDMERGQMDWESELERVRRRFLRDEPLTDDLDFMAPRRRHHHVPRYVIEQRIPNIMDHVPQKAVAPSHVNPGHFAVEYELRKFEPEEIKVQVDGNKLSVTAVHEEGENGSKVFSEFSKSVILPAHVDPDKLVSKLCNGILTVEMQAPPSYDSTLKASHAVEHEQYNTKL